MSDTASKDNFMTLFLSNQKRIYAFILMCIPNRTDADDLLQETAAWMWSNFDKYTPGTNFGAWGVSIARYKILNFCTNAKKTDVVFDEELLELIEHNSSQALEQTDRRIEALRLCLAKMSEKDRWLISLRYEKSLKINKIAELIERPTSGLYKKMAKIHSVLLNCTRSKLAMEVHND
ncbi:MAG: sigma-70 family RNA polymerase sigma factor [Sedimentisphaerales bacterium]|nr:sigma-70 family RNA polymerase sigma factor [Sedimentisphaerales bacterium]